LNKASCKDCTLKFQPELCSSDEAHHATDE
jgi:hypothetical protein